MRGSCLSQSSPRSLVLVSGPLPSRTVVTNPCYYTPTPPTVFLFALVASIIFLAYRALFEPSSFPPVRYANQGLLAVLLVTLVLFFASGMYQERIRYANKYVPHANRALRSINMHLNMRRPPRTVKSFLYYIPFFSKRSISTTSNGSKEVAAATATEIKTDRMNGSVPTGKKIGQGILTHGGKNLTAPASGKRNDSTSSTISNRSSSPSSPSVIPPIPPTNNPRGELIFSSKVDKTFREGYERYRAAFERRREEKMREQKARNSWLRWVWGGGEQSAGTGVGVGVRAGGARNVTGTMGRRPPPMMAMRGGITASSDPSFNVPRQGLRTIPSSTALTNNATASYPSGRAPRISGSASLQMSQQPSSDTTVTDSDYSSSQDCSNLSKGHKQKSESYSFILGQQGLGMAKADDSLERSANVRKRMAGPGSTKPRMTWPEKEGDIRSDIAEYLVEQKG